MINPFTWEQRVENILSQETNAPLFELEPHEIRIGIITLLTDEESDIHVFVNNKRAVMGRIYSSGDLTYLRERIEELDRRLRKTYKIVKIEAFLPFWLLRNLYLPSGWKPYKKSRKKRII